MRINAAKERLQAGKTVIGSEISRLRSAEIASIYASAGFDFVFIDMEHTPFSLETVADMIRAARYENIVPIVRVPQVDYAAVARVLDLGAQGIIAPRVTTVDEVESLVQWARHPPHGVRGFACTHYQTDDCRVEPQAFMDAVREQTLVVIQIERRQAIDDLEQLVSVPGVDVACLGYMDLSVDMGIPGEIEHPDMVAAIERLIAVSDLHHVAPGIIHPQIEMALWWMSRGMRFVSHSSDGLLLAEAARHAVARLRSSPGDGVPAGVDGETHAIDHRAGGPSVART